MKGHGVAGALASCRHTLRSAGVARGSLHMEREVPADASLGADKAAILFNARARGTKYTGGVTRAASRLDFSPL